MLVFLNGVGLLVLANMVYFYMFGVVRARLPDDKQVNRFAPGTELITILSRHKDLFPDSKLRLLMAVCAGGGFLCMFGAWAKWLLWR